MRTSRSQLAATGGPPAAPAGVSEPDDPPPGWFERIILPAIVVTYAVGMPVWSFGRVLAAPHQPAAALAAGLATACSVVLQAWLLVPLTQGRPPAMRAGSSRPSRASTPLPFR
jgi:hypothetical protein